MKIHEIIKNTSGMLYEMAYERKIAKKRIMGLSVPIIHHLIKLLKWDDQNNKEKHIRDINSWLVSISEIDLKNGIKPYDRDYNEWMFQSYITDDQSITNIINKELKGYKNLKIVKDDYEIYNIIKGIFHNLVYDLMTDKFEDIRNYYDFYK